MNFFNMIETNKREYRKKNDYVAYVEGSKIFNNSFDDAIPATIIVKAVRKHMESGSKVKKVAIIGFDGVRADCVVPIIKTEYDKHCNTEPFSLIQKYADIGGLMMSYTGGVKGNLQDTSTPPGWATVLTGTWINEHKVDWDGILDPKVPTVLMEYALKGKKAVFNAIWDKHFNVTYSKEIERCKNENLPLEYYRCEDNDDLLTQKMIKSVTTDDCDISFCVFEYPDHVGHGTKYGFWKQNPLYIRAIEHCDKNAYLINEAIVNRPTYNDEDWLIVVTTDHGGHLRGHGAQCFTDRTTFIATNKPELFK